MLEGKIDLDLPNGLVHLHRDDDSLSIATTKKPYDMAAQYVMEDTCYHPDTSATDRLRLTGEVAHD
eukprot:7886753-Pyramimonas_sp.AAC.1